MLNIDHQLHTHLDEVRKFGHHPIYIALAGSQNYDLANEDSDVDTKAIVVPTLRDLALNKQPVSATIKFDNGEQCDVKDIRLMFQNFKKQNINFLEILFTQYYLADAGYHDLFLTLRARAEEIAHYKPFVALKCMGGMAKEKFNKMEHISPASEEKIKQFGYDPKQLHHIAHLREFAERYTKGEDFGKCLKVNHKSYLMKLKKGYFSLEDARAIGELELNKLNNMIDYYGNEKWEGCSAVEELLNETVVQALRRSLHDEIVFKI